jgi:hypothetical protein
MRTSETTNACASVYVGRSRGGKWFMFNIDLQLGYTPQTRNAPRPTTITMVRVLDDGTEVCERLRTAGPSEGLCEVTVAVWCTAVAAAVRTVTA